MGKRMKTQAAAGKRILMLLAVLVALTGASAATEYFVDVNNGNDLNNGLSLAAPWQTLKNANRLAVAGDVITMRGGTYSRESDGYHSLIHPQNSGRAGNYITYKNYENESVILTGCYQPILLGYPSTSYIKIQGLIVDGGNRDTSAVNIFALILGNNNVIQNCTLKNEATNNDRWKGIGIEGSYNRISNCTIANVGYAAYPGAGVGEGIWVEGEHNLVENCAISHCGHNTILLRGKYNIARRNFLHSEIYRTCEVHSAGDAFSHLVFDSNVVSNSAGLGKGPMPTFGMQADAPGAIIRRNSFYNNHGHGIEIWGSTGGGTGAHMRVYNNVMTKNGTAADVGPQEGFGIEVNQPSSSLPGDVAMKNNIIFQNKGIGIFYRQGSDPTNPNHHTEVNNFKDTNGNPFFANEANHDYRLTLGSPCIDAGAFLTKTAQGGTGSSIFVEDAGYFTDGFGIVEGDLIQIQGQTEPARITYVDYGNNLISLDRTLTWTAGQGVGLAYKGSAPDMGAFEYEDSSPVPLQALIEATPVSGQAPLAVTLNASASGGEAPYAYSWNFGDGETSTSQLVAHTYAAAGEYAAELTVTDNLGAVATATQIISASNTAAALAAAISVTTTSGQAPLPVAFSATIAGGTSPYLCSWDFGDGAAADGHTVAHTYTAAGTYTATLTTTDGQGAIIQSSQTISVTAAANTLGVTLSASKTSGRAPLGVTFRARITKGTAPYAYTWDFGDGGTSSAAAPFHLFNTPAGYTVTLVVTDANGARGAATIAITAKDRPKPDLRFWPSNLNFATSLLPTSSPLMPSSAVKKRVVRIVKTGPANATLNWTVTSSESWISFSRTSGIGSGSVVAIINYANLPPGVYSATINVTSLEAVHPFHTIPVSLSVAQPAY